ncbi:MULTISPECIES: AI-2E family transporter [Ralstonia]|uniref:AI-2E family transporter n=1 Tax=Ralstonia mannitolilytica TaxID=105219 RepID=A0ABM9KCC2_9RALS|nr:MULTISPECIES: AI-2E family transporter [Ralstonia]AMP38730.1 AI-2E family transporter [Ralstonia solanacearum]AXV87555.1 AI-2E family transporter [Ralstonia solanacearum]AXW24797.1 AI-2E family transporter [Ralstonia solanacearum]AXW61195.1 AI-2E family transporter [Ralstonia solanacearum]AXW81714.1 AI-2E family transporter [Ralstonia solanacearum]
MLGFDPRAGKIVWTVFLFALAVLIVYKIASVLLVTVFAVFFSYLLYPLVERLERHMPRKVPRSVSIGIVFILVVVVAIVAGSVFGVTVQDEAGRLADQLPKLLDTSTMADRLSLPSFLEPLRARILEFVREQLSTSSDQAMPLVRNVGLGVMHAASNLVYLVLIPIMSFLMINEAPSIHAALLSWIRSSDKRMWAGIIEDLDTLLSRYVRALLLLSLATLVVYSIAFYLLGVPYALLLATTAAVLEFVPFAGPLAAVVATVTVAGFSGYPHLLWLIGFIVAYRLFQDYALNPYLMSEGVKVSPLLVIVGLLAGEQLGGVAGIFLSVPVIAALKIVLSRAWAAQSLGNEVR